MTTRASYCPFCGARLREDADSLETHLREREGCLEAFEAWDLGPAADPPRTRDRRRRRLRSYAAWVLILFVVGYALLIARNPLLGVIAAAVVYAAFRCVAGGRGW